MATHFSILAWRIPWTEETGRLQSMGSQRVGHYCSDLHKYACVIKRARYASLHVRRDLLDETCVPCSSVPHTHSLLDLVCKVLWEMMMKWVEAS